MVFGGNSGHNVKSSREHVDFQAVLPAEELRSGVSTIQIKGTEAAPVQEAISGDHRYEIVGARMTWDEANAYCESMGGHLATVTSQEEYQAIVNLAEASGRKVLWLGAVKGSDQYFDWISGESFAFSDWLSGEPNNEGGNENCLVMFEVKGRWVWADVPSDLSPYYGADKVGFVCEYD